MDLRPAVPSDLAAIVALERATFPRPWSSSALAEEIAGGEGRRLEVATGAEGEPLAGYLCCRAAAGELQILSVAVAVVRRRAGVGTALLRSALDWGAERGCRRAVLEVRPSNAAAISLYVGLGFQAAGRRPGAYSDNGEDALIMIHPMGRP